MSLHVYPPNVHPGQKGRERCSLLRLHTGLIRKGLAFLENVLIFLTDSLTGTSITPPLTEARQPPTRLAMSLPLSPTERGRGRRPPALHVHGRLLHTGGSPRTWTVFLVCLTRRPPDCLIVFLPMQVSDPCTRAPRTRPRQARSLYGSGSQPS